MEYEILNEILTSTVASIFPNKNVHLSYFKQNEETPIKSDIPRSIIIYII